MLAGFDKRHQLARMNPDALRIHKRMEIELLSGHERLVDNDRYAPLLIVDQRQRRKRAGLDSEYLAHLVGLSKAEPSSRSDACVQIPQVDGAIFVSDEQKQATLLVSEQKVLRELASHLAAQRLSFLDRAVRGIGEDRNIDAELTKTFEQALATSAELLGIRCHSGPPPVS